MSQLPGFTDPTVINGQAVTRYEDLSPEQKQAAQKHFARPKRLDEMTAAEIREQWQKARPAEFAQTDPLYTMSMDELRAKAAAEARAAAAAELDQRQAQSAISWMASEPRYRPTQRNAEVLDSEIQRRKLAGTVSDLQTVFADLAAQGKLELNPPPAPQPARVYSEAELRAMPLDEMRAAIAEMARNGIY